MQVSQVNSITDVCNRPEIRLNIYLILGYSVILQFTLLVISYSTHNIFLELFLSKHNSYWGCSVVFLLLGSTLQNSRTKYVSVLDLHLLSTHIGMVKLGGSQRCTVLRKATVSPNLALALYTHRSGGTFLAFNYRSV